MERFCHNCNASQSATAKFCASCGAQTLVAPVQPDQPQNYRPLPAKKNPFYKRWWLWLTVAFVSVGIISAIAVGFNAMRENNQISGEFYLNGDSPTPTFIFKSDSTVSIIESDTTYVGTYEKEGNIVTISYNAMVTEYYLMELSFKTSLMDKSGREYVKKSNNDNASRLTNSSQARNKTQSIDDAQILIGHWRASTSRRYAYEYYENNQTLNAGDVYWDYYFEKNGTYKVFYSVADLERDYALSLPLQAKYEGTYTLSGDGWIIFKDVKYYECSEDRAKENLRNYGQNHLRYQFDSDAVSRLNMSMPYQYGSDDRGSNLQIAYPKPNTNGYDFKDTIHFRKVG